MRFLTPDLLPIVGLAALPVIIHILSRLRLQRAQFPTLRLVQSVRRERFSWLRLRELLLLLFRTIALAALLLSVARPSCSPRAATPAQPAGDVVLIIDDSYSIAWGGTMERARAEARTLIHGLSGGRRCALLTASGFFDPPGTGEFLSDRRRLTRMVDSIRPSASAATLGPALARGLKLAQGRALLVVVTDLQQRSIPPDLRVEPGARVLLVDVGTDNAANACIAGVRLEPAFVTPTAPARLHATIVNHAARPAVRTVTVLMDETREQKTVSLPARARTDVLFETALTRPGNYTGRVVLDPDSLPLDDTCHFAFSVPERVRVLVLQSAGVPADYVLSALGTDSLSLFDLTLADARETGRHDLSRYAVVLVTDAASLAARDMDRLDFHVRGGGAALLLCGRGGQSQVRLPGFGSIEGERTPAGFVTIAGFDSTVPVLGWLAGTDLGSARFFSHARIVPSAGQVLCRFSDGDPAILSAAEGRATAWAFSPLPGQTDLVYKAAFVPLLHRTLVELALGPRARPHAPGDTVTVSLASSGPATLSTPSGNVVLSPAEGARPLLTIADTRLPGLYRLPAEPARSFAVNPDPEEADLTRASPAQLNGQGFEVVRSLGPAAREMSTALLWLAAAAFAAELLLLAL